MEFKLNEKEKGTLKKVIESLDIIYDISELRRTYQFIPSGLGNICTVKLVGYKDKNKVFEIEKDITDYDSW